MFQVLCSDLEGACFKKLWRELTRRQLRMAKHMNVMLLRNLAFSLEDSRTAAPTSACGHSDRSNPITCTGAKQGLCRASI